MSGVVTKKTNTPPKLPILLPKNFFLVADDVHQINDNLSYLSYPDEGFFGFTADEAVEKRNDSDDDSEFVIVEYHPVSIVRANPFTGYTILSTTKLEQVQGSSKRCPAPNVLKKIQPR